MADNVLQGTLPQETGGSLVDFQKAMRMASTEAYDSRAKEDQKTADKQFDPTKVSGSTFAGIMGNLEAERGKDISKIYASTVDAYKAQIAERSKGSSAAATKQKLLDDLSADFATVRQEFDQYIYGGQSEEDIANRRITSQDPNLRRGKVNEYVDIDTYNAQKSRIMEAYKEDNTVGEDFDNAFSTLLSPEDQATIKMTATERNQIAKEARDKKVSDEQLQKTVESLKTLSDKKKIIPFNMFESLVPIADRTQALQALIQAGYTISEKE